METLIGFVVGYMVGAKEGKGGLERLKVSVNSIIASPEARKMVAEAMALAQPVIQRGPRQPWQPRWRRRDRQHGRQGARQPRVQRPRELTRRLTACPLGRRADRERLSPAPASAVL